MSEAALRRHTEAEIAHWRLAVESLAALEAVASPDAWSSLESYLQREVKSRMQSMVDGLKTEADALKRQVESGADLGEVRTRLLQLRKRYLQAETILDFFDDAISSRSNPQMAVLLRGYDTLAADSMAATFTPMGVTTPPALVYIDKGLGAAILRAGIRLWDRANPSPAAAIKLTRHNLFHPTSLLHETGHQVAHQTGWNDELTDALYRGLTPVSPEVAQAFSSWAREIAADVHAFVQTGWAAVSALANVVDGPTHSVFRVRIGDPHPPPFIRVLFSAAMCRAWFGHGPWDDIEAAWVSRHPLKGAGGNESLTRASVEALPLVVDICTNRPMRSFGGRPITAHLDPRRVSPSSLEELSTTAGDTLLTSSYLRRRESLRILGLLAARSVTEPIKAAEHRSNLRQWIDALGRDASSTPALTGIPAA